MNNLAKIVLFVLVLAGGPAWAGKAEEKIDNPLYKHWAQFKPGSYATLKMTTESMGTTSETLLTQTLKEVTAEKVVVEIKTAVTGGGQKIEQPPTLQDIPAKITKIDVAEQEAKDKIEERKQELKEGEEEVDAGGKKLKAKWTQTEAKYGEIVIKTKVWTSEEVPGQTVKAITSTEGEFASKSTTELVDFKADRK